ncbi:MAG: site-specific DNA-methyltransferase [Phycisphaerales bacterium]
MTTIQAPAVTLNGHGPARREPPNPAHTLTDPEARVYVGDCRDVLGALPEIKARRVDMIFADPPFNWSRAYDEWKDDLPHDAYLKFTYDWLDLCIQGLRPWGALWVNIPDDWAAEIVVHLKRRRMCMINWCIWHYRFGQNTKSRFINSKVHALYFVRPPSPGEAGPCEHTWNPDRILETSDRRAIYFDPRTENKRDGMPAGLRVPMDVWYGKNWGRIQGNNKERRHAHDNQLPETYLQRVVLCSSNEGDLVLDPFLGSGTTGVVAHALGRRFIGCEFSKENAKRAFQRIKEGPIRKLGQALGASTAIHPSRRKRTAK